MRLSIPWMLQAISYIAIAIFLFNAYKSKRQKYIRFLALFFLVFGLVAFLILVISAITQMSLGERKVVNHSGVISSAVP